MTEAGDDERVVQAVEDESDHDSKDGCPYSLYPSYYSGTMMLVF